MTVDELIAELRKFPGDWEARVPCNKSNFNPATMVCRDVDRERVTVDGVPMLSHHPANAVAVMGEWS